jgi:dihydrofolate reductase
MATIYYTATSLDGFLATEDDSLDWLMSLGSVSESSYAGFIAGVGALCMGTATYEWMRTHAAEVTKEVGGPWPYTQPAWVFSHRDLPRITPEADVRFVQGDVRPVHAEMVRAANGRDVWVVGGGDLAGQFFDAGLLDQVIVQVGAVTLGRGKPLFPRRVTNPAWVLESVQPMGSALVELRYRIPRGS